jgi:hypothetical protein
MLWWRKVWHQDDQPLTPTPNHFHSQNMNRWQVASNTPDGKTDSVWDLLFLEPWDFLANVFVGTQDAATRTMAFLG